MRLGVDAITMDNAAVLTARGVAAMTAGDLVFDFGGVQRCDSAALAMVLEWERVAAERQLALRFETLPASFDELAALYGIDALICGHRGAAA